MQKLAAVVFGLLVSSAAANATSCGLSKEVVPPGTPIQQVVMHQGEDWRINFSQARTHVVSAKVIRRPCHGRSLTTRPVGFRYIPAPGFQGIDSMLVKACNGSGECSHTGFVMLVR